jgi:glycerophosphoryl diester phosphodiesterase
MKLLLTIALGALALAGVSLALGAALSAPSRGKRSAQALGIPRPAVIAHRGASFYAPESTRPAYLLAHEMGADYLELDLQRSRDGVLVVFHDDDLSRTTDVAEVFPGREHAPVGTFTFEELERLDAGSWFNRRFPTRARPAFRGLRILRLEDVVALAESRNRRPGLYIETKSARRYPGIELELIETLAARGWIDRAAARPQARVILQSFELDSLARLQALAPQVPRIWLIDETLVAREGWNSLLKQAQGVASGIGTWGLRHALSLRWDRTAAPVRYFTTWPWYTGQAHRAGLVVHAWTVNDRWELGALRFFGVDGFFTDRPDLALAVCGRGSAPELDRLWEAIGY